MDSLPSERPSEQPSGSVIYLPTVDRSSSYMGSESNRNPRESDPEEEEEEREEAEEDMILARIGSGSGHPNTRVTSGSGARDVAVISLSLDRQIQQLVDGCHDTNNGIAAPTPGDPNSDMNFLRYLLTDKKNAAVTPGGTASIRCRRCANHPAACKRCVNLGLAANLSNASKLVFLSPDNTTREAPAYTSLMPRQEGDCRPRAQSRNARERPAEYRSSSAAAGAAASCFSSPGRGNRAISGRARAPNPYIIPGTPTPGTEYTPPPPVTKPRAHTAKPGSHGGAQPGGVLLTEPPARRAASAATVIRARSGHLSSGGSRDVGSRLLERIKYESQERRLQRLEREPGVRRPRSCKTMRRDRAQTHLLKRGASKDSYVITAREKRLRARLKFRTAHKRVLAILRCMRCIVAMSSELTTRTAVEDQWHTLNTSKEARKLAFNPSVYAKSRAYAKLPKWSKRLLDKTTEERTDSDCRRLHALLRGLRSFDKFTEKIQLAMCKSFTFQEVGAQRIILRKGHIGQNFYFIYSGSVFVNVEDVNAQGEKFVKTEVVLSKGDAFGELALLKDITRTATISCRETCELLVVDKEVFSSVCPKIFDLELETKVTFLCNLALFHSKYWKHEAIHNLCFDSHIQEYKTNKVVVLDSTKEEWMYICMEGQCRVIKSLELEADEQEEVPVLLREDEMLTAEFLQVDNDAGKKTRSRHNSHKSPRVTRHASSGTNNEMHSKRKKQMLQSLSLEYVSNKQEKDLLSRNAEEKRVQEHRKRAQQGVITLTNLMQQRKEENPKRDLVYLDIGTLQTTEVFDLADILRQHPSKDNTSCHILVSSGAKLLRVRKDTFGVSLSDEARDHAKHIAMRNLYPSNSVLVKSYKEKAKWDRYKDKIVGDVMVPVMNQARRREIVRRIRHLEEQAREHDDRVLHTLTKDDDNVDPEAALLELPENLALEEKELIDYEDSENKALKEADTIKDRFHAVRKKADSAKASNIRDDEFAGDVHQKHANSKSAPPMLSSSLKAPSVIVEEEDDDKDISDGMKTAENNLTVPEM